MVQRNKRGDHIQNPDRLLSALGACRASLLEASKSVMPTGPAYHALSMVVSAIDSLATFMTGQPYYFINDGPGLMARMPPSATPKSRED